MEKKKVILTILLAALLALGLIFLFMYRAEKLDNEIQETVQQEEQTETAETVPEKVETTKSVETNNQTKAVVKSSAKNQTQISTKEVPNVANEAQETVQEARIQNDEVEEVSKDVEVPVKYVSNNTYKYVYTPAKFPKKKLKAN